MVSSDRLHRRRSAGDAAEERGSGSATPRDPGRLHVLTIVGTRPEAIKLAPVVLALRERAAEVESAVCLTSQHDPMAADALAEFGVRADHDLKVMREEQTLAGVATRVITGLEQLLRATRPHRILVQGDTASVVAASMAAFYAGVPVGHVEAGLRTHDVEHPFPEEAHRRITTILADMHFAPTDAARRNLLAEGVDERRIHVTGNPGIDALRIARDMAPDDPGPFPENPGRRHLIVVTAHRRESFGESMASICRAIRHVAEARSDVCFAFVVHPNPQVQRPVRTMLDGVDGVALLGPLAYVHMIGLISRAAVVLTDSGGIQEEAVTLGVPLIVMRETTERYEGVEAGAATLVGRDAAVIERATLSLLADPAALAGIGAGRPIYGDGHAAQRIVDAVVRERRG